MDQKRSLLISIVVHGAIFFLLVLRIDWTFRPAKASIPIEARLVIKNAKNKDFLPRKNLAALPMEEEKKKDVVDVAPQKPVENNQDLKGAVAKSTKPASPSTKKAVPDYTKALTSLSQSFARELAETKPSEPEGEAVVDDNYFDQVYTLIKEGFVVPPHINGPQGKNLKAVLKIHLAADGSILQIDVQNSSGDEQFDKAVLDGTRRVNNFGIVPPTLQNMVRERGIVVELCPFTCTEK